MTRPTILDLDLVVVPRETTNTLDVSGVLVLREMPSNAAGVYEAMLSASPYPTAWDDVRKYVEEMERERDEATGTLRYCEKQWSDERGVMIDKFVYERNRAEAAERQLSEIAGHMDSECDSDSILHVVREAEADRDIYKDRAASAEARIAELEKRLADAERVIEPFARLGTMSTHIVNEDGTASFSFFRTADMNAFTDARRAARAYMEGK